MAGTGTVTLNKIRNGIKEVWEIVCDWTSDATGLVQLNVASILYANGKITANKISGNLLAIEVIPGASGDRSTTIPLNLATHTFLDDYSFDLSESNFINQATAAASKKYCNPPIFVRGDIQLNITSVGATGKTGRDILWIEREGA